MKIIIVDDEPRARQILEIMLRELGEKDICSFESPLAALDHLRQKRCDLALVDIEMPEMDGLTLAKRIQGLPAPPAVVFVTAYPQYALQAWDAEVVDYILKPLDRRQLQRALERAAARRPEIPRVEIRCFPTFGLWVDEVPLMFSHKKSKELLAFLVHMQGAWVSTDQVSYALFETGTEKNAKNYYRIILHRLRQTLTDVGLDDLVENGYGKVRVNTSLFSCDYYRYLKGERDLFFGEYLSEYSWAEATLADLRRRSGS